MGIILEGTPKQVAWAEEIRAKALAEHAEFLAAGRARGSNPAKIGEVEALCGRMAGIDDARWWIEIGTLPRASRLKLIDWTYRDGSWHDGAGVAQRFIPV